MSDEEKREPFTIDTAEEEIAALKERLDVLENAFFTHDHVSGNLVRKYE